MARLLLSGNEAIFSDRMTDMVALTKTIQDRLHAVIGLHPKIKLVEPGGVGRSEGKAKRMIDRRVVD